MDSFPWHQTPPRGSAEAGKGPGSRVELQLWGGGKRPSLPDLHESLERSGSGRESCVLRGQPFPEAAGNGPGTPRPPCRAHPVCVCSPPDH